MSIVRYNSLLAPSTFSNLFDQVFSDHVLKSGTQLRFVPDVDLLENEDSYQIHVALPGFEKDKIKLEVEQNNLKISGERVYKHDEQNFKVHSVETSYGSFQRSFRLPSDAHTQDIQAEYQQGILHVVVPKDKKHSNKTLIEVK